MDERGGPNIIQRCSWQFFVLLLLLASCFVIQVVTLYLSAASRLPDFPITRASASRAPVPPAQGPNVTVAAYRLTGTLERITAQQISLTIGDKNVPVSPGAIRGWLQVVTDKNKHVSYIHVKDNAIASTLADMAAPFLKTPINEVAVTRSDGSSRIIGAGKNGVGMGDTEQLRQQITQKLLSAKGLQLNLPLQSAPFQTVSAAAIDKLLEVDVAAKQMRAYDKGQLTGSFPISAGAPSTPTPIGQFRIYQKLPVQDMRGLNADGSKYFQPHVRWVNYFLPGGYAVHGNYWRPDSWFGAINSSHGCVSLPETQAKWVYDWAPLGTIVITHN